MALKHYLKYVNKLSKIVVYVCIGIYLIAGIAKILNPGHSFEALNQLSSNLLNFEFSFEQQVNLIIIFSIWEIVLGILFYAKIHVIKTLWAFLFTNLFLTFVSHYLSFLNSLQSCGCLGELTSSFNEIHMPFLYIFNVTILYEILRHYNPTLFSSTAYNNSPIS